VTNAGPLVDGKYTIGYNASITLGGNTAVAGHTYTWNYTTVPPGKTITFNQAIANPTVSGFEKGVEYTFTLTITNQNNLSSAKSVKIAVTGNLAPTVDAGIAQNVTLANDLTVTLQGTADDDDGNIVRYTWTCLSYTANKGAVTTAYTPLQVTNMLNNANTAAATVDLRKAGTYVFQLEVEDNDGATATSPVTVTVDPQNVTKKVTVTFPAFEMYSQPTLNLTPIYPDDGNWGEFTSNDIVYTVEDSEENTWTATTGFEIDASPYPDSAWATFTQIFRYNDEIIKSQTINSAVMDLSGGAGTNMIFAELADSTLTVPYEEVPPMTFTLSKDKTEVN